MSKQDSIKTDGTVVESLGCERFRVELDNGITVLATVSGRVRLNRIRVMTGDRVEVEMSPYDMTRGRISFRHNVKRHPDAVKKEA